MYKDAQSGEWKDLVDKHLENVATSDKTEETVTKPETLSREQYYGRIPENHLMPVKVLMKDPIYLNPNSFENIIKIFRTMLGKNKNRKWIIIYSDGVPFLLGEKVILWSFVCTDCGEKIFRESAWNKHVQEKHAQSKPSRGLEFENIWLMPGGGHIFMQMLKGE